MPIHLITEKATPEQIAGMLEFLESYIKLAVDVERRILTGGGKLHADCEEVLLWTMAACKKMCGEPIGYLL